MASINYLYRSTRENQDLEIRLSFKDSAGIFRVLATESKIKIFSREEFPPNPFWKLDKYKGKENPYQIYQSLIENNSIIFFAYYKKKPPVIFPAFTDIEKINGVSIIEDKKSELKSRLNRLANFILTEFENADINSISKEWIEAKISSYHRPKNGNQIPGGLLEYIDHFIKVKPELAGNTSKKFTTVKAKLLDRLSQFDYNRTILVSDVDDHFRVQYETIYKDYSKNTVAYDLSQIKTLIAHAGSKGANISGDVEQWKIKYVDNLPVYLDFLEIEKIASENIDDRLIDARDWLIISCYCGQRVSDFMRFRKSMIRYERNINKEMVALIEFTQEKGNKLLALPLHPEILKILTKRGGEFPDPIIEQVYNRQIKEVARMAGVSSMAFGGKFDPDSKRKVFGYFEKWELVSSHIGRRSYATNHYGIIPTPLIMSATGHTTEAKFLKYIGKTTTDRAHHLAEYFFRDSQK